MNQICKASSGYFDEDSKLTKYGQTVDAFHKNEEDHDAVEIVLDSRLIVPFVIFYDGTKCSSIDYDKNITNYRSYSHFALLYSYFILAYKIKLLYNDEDSKYCLEDLTECWLSRHLEKYNNGLHNVNHTRWKYHAVVYVVWMLNDYMQVRLFEQVITCRVQ